MSAEPSEKTTAPAAGSSPAGLRRPLAVTWLSAGLLLAGALQLLASTQFAEQARHPGNPLPADLAGWSAVGAVIYAAGGLSWLAAVLGLILVRRWGRRLALLAVPVILALEWVLRLALDRSNYARAALPLDVAVTLGELVIVYVILWWPAVSRRFAEADRGMP